MIIIIIIIIITIVIKSNHSSTVQVLLTVIKFVIRHLYFATFLVENVFFSASFWAGPPPLKKWKAKKNK